MKISVVIRTYNEEKYLGQLLQAISQQQYNDVDIETVLVDSGSTDKTISIANQFEDIQIVNIKKADFTFGYSLNRGCAVASGDILVFVSGHCIPHSINWLFELVRPLLEDKADYVYGRQIGACTTKFSEKMHFSKWFPSQSNVPQKGYFCNNANAAIRRSVWQDILFDEEITGLEDMDMAKKIIASGKRVGYVATAPVLHIHDESWKQVRIRYEREAYALKTIMPELHFSRFDFVFFFCTSILSDFAEALKERAFLRNCYDIVLFRFNQYLGTFNGNHEVRRMSKSLKFRYFYPKEYDGNLNHD